MFWYGPAVIALTGFCDVDHRAGGYSGQGSFGLPRKRFGTGAIPDTKVTGPSDSVHIPGGAG